MIPPDDHVDPALLARLDATDRMLAEQILVNAGGVARSTFVEFEDDPESEFAVASHLDAAETWRAILDTLPTTGPASLLASAARQTLLDGPT